MNDRRRIFVSSVQRELAAERRALCDFVEGDALLRRYFDVFLFEDVPASGRRADDVYLAEVDRTDIYVGILGDEYGPEDGSGRSPTECEFDRATQGRKERLVFVRGTDDATRHPKMRAFLARVGDQTVRRRFREIPELTALVYASLVDYLAAIGALRTKPFDASACPDATLDDLSESKLVEFLQRAQRRRGYVLAADTPLPDALSHLNLLDRELPTHAAVLLFGKNPQRFLTTSEVKCLHFHGTEVQKPIPSYQIYKGDVFQLVDQSVDFVMSKIDATVGTRAAGPTTPVTYEMPRDTVAEAIVNAVAHRDYASNASVQVMLFSDRLEIWNPGQLPATLTIASLSVPHASIPRNPLIAEPLFLTGYIEKAGTGTLDMIAQCRAAGLPAPTFRQDGGQFIQVVSRPAATDRRETTPPVSPPVAPPLTQPVARLLELLSGVQAVGAAEIRKRLGLKDRAHVRDRFIDPALAEGMIEMTIPDRPNSRLQEYRLSEKGRAWLTTRGQ